MTYHGHVENGVVVFANGLAPAEGAVVRVAVTSAEPDTQNAPSAEGETLYDQLADFVGIANDFARNHDHYVHGAPKLPETSE